MTGVEILEELMQEDYERYVYNHYQSRFSEEDWEWLIERFKQKKQEIEGRGKDRI